MDKLFFWISLFATGVMIAVLIGAGLGLVLFRLWQSRREIPEQLYRFFQYDSVPTGVLSATLILLLGFMSTPLVAFNSLSCYVVGSFLLSAPPLGFIIFVLHYSIGWLWRHQRSQVKLPKATWTGTL